MVLKSTHPRKEGRSRDTSFCRCPLCLFASITKFYLPANTALEELPFLLCTSYHQAVWSKCPLGCFRLSFCLVDSALTETLTQIRKTKKTKCETFARARHLPAREQRQECRRCWTFFVGAPPTFLRLTDERHRLTPMRAANAP